MKRTICFVLENSKPGQPLQAQAVFPATIETTDELGEKLSTLNPNPIRAVAPPTNQSKAMGDFAKLLIKVLSALHARAGGFIERPPR